jgi:hypothetical protein
VLVLDYAGAIFYFLKWLEEERKADLVVLILFSVFAAFTKNEGLALALIVAAVMLLSCAVARTRIKWAGFFSFVGGVLLLLSPWLWWSRNLPRTHENYGAQLRPAVVIENWNRINVILADFLRQGAAWSKWGGIWLLLLLVAVFGARGFRRQNVVVLWLLLFAQLSLYVLIFVVTPWNVQELLDSALDRLLLQTLPLVVLLIGFHWSEIARAADVAVPRR